MALPPSPNQISLGDIQTEFGGSNPIGINEYYKNGGIVDSDDFAPNVPTSGQISIGNFHSAYKVTLSVTIPHYDPLSLGTDIGLSAYALGSTYAFADASITLYANGNGLYFTQTQSDAGGFSTSNTFTWLSAGSASDVYAYLDTPSGDAPTGSATATSLQMNATRSWGWQADASGTNSRFATSTLRLKNSGGTDLDTASVSIDVSASLL
jgi:hypothetical protein